MLNQTKLCKRNIQAVLRECAFTPKDESEFNLIARLNDPGYTAKYAFTELGLQLQQGAVDAKRIISLLALAEAQESQNAGN